MLVWVVGVGGVAGKRNVRDWLVVVKGGGVKKQSNGEGRERKEWILHGFRVGTCVSAEGGLLDDDTQRGLFRFQGQLSNCQQQQTQRAPSELNKCAP